MYQVVSGQVSQLVSRSSEATPTQSLSRGIPRMRFGRNVVMEETSSGMNRWQSFVHLWTLGSPPAPRPLSSGDGLSLQEHNLQGASLGRHWAQRVLLACAHSTAPLSPLGRHHRPFRACLLVASPDTVDQQVRWGSRLGRATQFSGPGGPGLSSVASVQTHTDTSVVCRPLGLGGPGSRQQVGTSGPGHSQSRDGDPSGA